MREVLTLPAEKLADMGGVGAARVAERHDAAKEAEKLAALFRAAREHGRRRRGGVVSAIAGILGRVDDAANLAALDRMLAAMTHRGPDGAGQMDERAPTPAATAAPRPSPPHHAGRIRAAGDDRREDARRRRVDLHASARARHPPRTALRQPRRPHAALPRRIRAGPVGRAGASPAPRARSARAQAALLLPQSRRGGRVVARLRIRAARAASLRNCSAKGRGSIPSPPRRWSGTASSCRRTRWC